MMNAIHCTLHPVSQKKKKKKKEEEEEEEEVRGTCSAHG
jgi:hypothetical protein